jgi:hypothetical protein
MKSGDKVRMKNVELEFTVGWVNNGYAYIYTWGDDGNLYDQIVKISNLEKMNGRPD